MHNHTKARRGYAICTAPRSGSNLLCQWLASTGVLGRPLEYFNGPARRVLDDPAYPDDRVAQVEWIRTKSATPNGLYGVKLFSDNRTLVSPVGEQTPVLPVHTYIYLERRDRLGQAMSWVRALQTQQYRSTQPVQEPARYDGAAIRDRLRAINVEHENWSAFFRQHALQPLCLYYEDAMHDPQSVVDRIASCFHLGSRALINHAAIDLKIQRDGTTAEWRARYLREFGEPSDRSRLGQAS
jgi:LPS sulfotransferase NodH